MLIISRKVGESVTIGDDIRITILRGGGRSENVRLGIEAPRDVEILRDDAVNRSDKRTRD